MLYFLLGMCRHHVLLIQDVGAWYRTTVLSVDYELFGVGQEKTMLHLKGQTWFKLIFYHEFQ